jgi:chromosome partitioning protein
MAKRPTSRRSQCVAFANHKGGTGKTTSCLSIAGYLAKGGSKVLVVDFDPQSNATSGLGIEKKSLSSSMYDVVLGQCDGQQGLPLVRVIVETEIPNLHLAPSEFDLAVAECYILKSHDRTNLLRRILEPVRPYYDYILIDSPPASGLLTINSLCAADHVVVPVDPSIFALEAMDDLKRTFSDIQRLTGHVVHTLGAVLIRYAKPNGRKSTVCQEVEASLREMFCPVFLVPAADEIYHTQQQGVPISHYAPRSGVGKAYEKIAKTILLNARARPMASKS